MKKTDVYLDAKNSAKAPVNYGKALVDEPVDTMKNTAKGLGITDVGYSIVPGPQPGQCRQDRTRPVDGKRAFAFELGETHLRAPAGNHYRKSPGRR